MRQYLGLAGAFQVVQIVKGVIHALAANDDAVVAQKADICALHGMGDALALAAIQRKAVVLAVHRHAAMKAHCVLAQGGVERALLRQGECGCVRHVRMQHAGLAGDAVHGRVDEHGGRFHSVPTCDHTALVIDDHHIIGLHLAPPQPARVEQKVPAIG
ncbi:hypothetical protein D3C72_1165610 [compost metagenome]